ncbi:MAG: hypothetical protein ABI644_13815 [Arenimonas sp.]
MEMDVTTLLQSMWWSTLGVSYFIYGKRQGKIIAMTCGVFLIGFPYFVSNNIWMFVIGVVLSIIPWRWEL